MDDLGRRNASHQGVRSNLYKYLGSSPTPPPHLSSVDCGTGVFSGLSGRSRVGRVTTSPTNPEPRASPWLDAECGVGAVRSLVESVDDVRPYLSWGNDIIIRPAGERRNPYAVYVIVSHCPALQSSDGPFYLRFMKNRRTPRLGLDTKIDIKH